MEIEATELVEAARPSLPRRLASTLSRHERLLDECFSLLVLGAVLKIVALANSGYAVATVLTVSLVALFVWTRDDQARRSGARRPFSGRTMAAITAAVCAILVVPADPRSCWVLVIGAGVLWLAPRAVRWFSPAYSEPGRGPSFGISRYEALVDHAVLVLRLAGISLLAVAALVAVRVMFAA